MKPNIKHNEDCELFFDVVIPKDEVEKTLQDVYKEIKKYAKIPGFRPGKAPDDLIEKFHGPNAQEETLKRLIPAGCQKYLDEKKIDALGLPDIYDVVFERGKNLSFKAKIEVRPSFTLKNYKGIKVTSKKAEATDGEVGDVLKRLQDVHGRFRAIEEKRPVKRGDFVVCDVETFIDGKPISRKYENMMISADKESSLLEIGEHLIGGAAGDTKEIRVTLPADYPDKKFAGKEADFKVALKEIKEKKLPEIDDEFAKMLGEENASVMRENIKKQLTARKEEDDRIGMKNQMLEKLLKDNKIPVPGSMARRQYELLNRHFEEQMMSRGVPKGAVAEKQKELEKQLREEAADKVRVFFILTEIARIENIKLKEEDVTARFEDIAKRANKDAEAVRQYYETNNLTDGLLVQLQEDKTLDWLLGKAEVSQG